MTSATHLSGSVRRAPRWIRAFLILLALAAPLAARAADAGVRRALLIGINRYSAVPGLQGSVNDVESMREILISRYGFEPRNITMLTDEAATRAAMMAALEKLVDDTGPADTVYLHYSGHGSQVEDLSGDEVDHLDETLVPQDGRSGTVRDIVDDELAAILARLKAKSAIIVLDSCHSGTATRALDIRARSVPQDSRIDLYKEATRTRAIVPTMSSRFVVLSATAKSEEALDGPIEGRYQGFFTHALARSLSNAPPGATLNEVFAGVGRELARLQAQVGRASMPEPQLEAPPALLNAPLFVPLHQVDATATAAMEPRLPWLAVLPLTPEEGILQRATLLGAAPGARFSVYPPGETQFRPGEAIGVATVVRLDGRDAVAHFETNGTPFNPGSRAVALLPPPAASRVPVRLLAATPERRAQVDAILSRDIVNVVGPGEPAQYLIDAQGTSIKLLSADGTHVLGEYAAASSTSAADLGRVLQRAANAAEILSLDNAAARIQIGAHVVGRPALQQRGIAVVADTQAAPLHIRRSGETRAGENSLQLEITASQDAYVTIVDVDSEGSVNLLFPNDYQSSAFYPQGLVRAGELLRVPDSLQPGNRAGFYWDYTPPRGTDTVRVFASADLATAKLIRDRVRALQHAPAGGGSGHGTRALSQGVDGLRAALANVAARGIQVIADDTASSTSTASPAGAPAAAGTAPLSLAGSGDWAATTVTIELSDAPSGK